MVSYEPKYVITTNQRFVLELLQSQTKGISIHDNWHIKNILKQTMYSEDDRKLLNEIRRKHYDYLKKHMELYFLNMDSNRETNYI